MPLVSYTGTGNMIALLIKKRSTDVPIYTYASPYTHCAFVYYVMIHTVIL